MSINRLSLLILEAQGNSIERISLTYLRTRTAALSDKDAVKVVTFVTQSLQADLRRRVDLPAELRGTILTDDDAVDLLGEAFPDLSKALEQARSTASVDERGRIARNFLLLLSEEAPYARRIEKGIEQLQFVADPITWMAVGASIVFLLSIKFNVTSKMFEGKRRVEWEVSRDATPVELVTKILGIETPSEESSVQPDSDEGGSKSDSSTNAR